MGSRTAAIVTLALAFVGACASVSRQRGNGEQCELNSQCGAPLVCRLGACRNECNTDRDCPARSSCVRDGDGLGICQVPAERSCALDSDCGSPLVCRSMRCVNTCATDRDCPAGNMCTGGSCVDTTDDAPCVRDSDCMGELVCTSDARCRIECVSDRDCRLGTTCQGAPSGYCDFGPRPDAGTDAGAPMDGGDGGMPDGGDGGMPVCPPLDGGCPPQGTHATALALGFDYACALLDNERVACWGNNSQGELGSSCATTSFSSVPVLADVSGVAKIRAGSGAMCAVLVGGGLRCWGRNYGLLVLGDSRASIPPTDITLGGPVTDVAPGQYAMFAIVGGSELWAWGSPVAGSLGDGRTASTDPFTTAPVDVGTFPGATDVVAYRHGGCIDASGVVSCWGENMDGQAGQGDVLIHATPVAVPGLPTVDQLVGFDNAVCARSGGSAHCWGNDLFGQLGDGTPGAIDSSPTSNLLMGATSLSMGTFAACATYGSGAATCWGEGEALGDMIGTTRATPDVDVVGLPPGLPVDAVAVGAYFGCAIVNGFVYCWGENGSGQLGPGFPTGVTSFTAGLVDCLP